jgi:ATP-binding cassette subfamily B protein
LSGVRVLGSIGADTMTLEWGTSTVPALGVLERHLASLQAAQGSAAHPSVDSPPARQATAAVPAAPTSPPTPGIRFEGVTFRYPGSGADTLSGLDLELPAGRSLAIVGVNGAGKTTLVKLLCRLYEPHAGRITADGVPIAALEPPEWRRRLAAIFQDFVQYHMPARDNVGFGALAHAGDQSRLERAAELVGALDLVQRLPQGWDTILARHYKGGTDLSGGEWQRIALARALFAVNGGADVLILDEPTANLDVRAEAALYDRFLDITAGLTTILISHRFSTVRRAHRIAVLEGGRVVEQGSHEELLARRGRYAQMFTLQASRFTEEAPPA